MKKILSIVLCCLVAVSAFSQQALVKKHPERDADKKVLNFRPAEKMALSVDYNYRMSSYTTSDEYITCRYSYDNYRRLIAIQEDVPSEYQLIDSIRYNEQNQLVRLDGYQLLGNQWMHIYYIEYGYNAQGLISSRSNYNYMNGEFELGGIYEYFYNSNGQIISTELTMADMFLQSVEYEYENGLLATETWYYVSPFSSTDELSPSERIDYSYNSDGNLSLVTYNVYGEYEWGYYGKRTYTYDEVGNCTEIHAYDADDMETERSVFTFENRLLEETLIPWNPEITRPQTLNNKNIYTVEEYWSLDVNWQLQYVCDYEYYYVDIDAVGLNDVKIRPLEIYPNPAENSIRISGLSDGVNQMEIADMYGRIVKTGTLTDSTLIDISDLQKGCYVVKVVNGDSVYSTKVIVK